MLTDIMCVFHHKAQGLDRFVFFENKQSAAASRCKHSSKGNSQVLARSPVTIMEVECFQTFGRLLTLCFFLLFLLKLHA